MRRPSRACPPGRVLAALAVVAVCLFGQEARAEPDWAVEPDRQRTQVRGEGGNGRRPVRDEADLVPGSTSLGLEVGYFGLVYGGQTVTAITLNKTPDDDWHTHANGLGFRLLYDLPYAGLDWRFKFGAAVPAYAAFSATAGIRKNLSPSPDFRLMARAGAGLEGMFAWEGPGSTFTPLFLGEGELAALFNIGSEAFAVGPALDLAIRYGMPLGLGPSVGLFLRAEGRW